MPSTLIKSLLLFSAVLLLSGCTLVPAGGQASAKPDGGIWRSNDGGKIFKQVNDVLATQGKILSMNNADIVGLAFDPQDPAVIYAASGANGIFFTGDAGNSWQQYKVLKQGKITQIAADYQDKCVVYATADNKLFKTENCGRDWNNIYYHQKSQVFISSLALDPKSPLIIYLGTTEGEVLKSADGGNQWITIDRVKNDKIMDIIVYPYDSKIIYVGTGRTGIFKSVNGGAAWNSLGEGIKSYSGSQQYKKLIYDAATANSLIFISKFGMLKSADGGATWKVVELLPASKTTGILAVAVNPLNSSEFYYATASTLIKTTDGGSKWSSQKLPYGRLTTDIKINHVNPEIIYLSTQLASK